MALRDLLPAMRHKQQVPVRRDEWISPFQSLQKGMNEMFDRFFSDFNPARYWSDEMRGSYFPSADVRETAKDIRVELELPGLDEKDIDISISDDVLTVRGEKRMEHEEKEEGYYHMERSYGSFHRRIPLPGEVDTDKADALFKKGILKITLPKKPEAQQKSKRIEIKAG